MNRLNIALSVSYIDIRIKLKIDCITFVFYISMKNINIIDTLKQLKNIDINLRFPKKCININL